MLRFFPPPLHKPPAPHRCSGSLSLSCAMSSFSLSASLIRLGSRSSSLRFSCTYTYPPTPGAPLNGSRGGSCPLASFLGVPHDRERPDLLLLLLFLRACIGRRIWGHAIPDYLSDSTFLIALLRVIKGTKRATKNTLCELSARAASYFSATPARLVAPLLWKMEGNGASGGIVLA